MEVLDTFEELAAALERGDVEELAAALEGALAVAWGEQVRQAIRDAQEALASGQDVDQAELIGVMRRRLTQDLTRSVAESVRLGVEATYQVGREEAGSGGLFTPVDRRALAALEDDTLFWVGTHYDSEVRARLTGMAEETFKEGIGNFQQAQRLQDSALGERFTRSQSYWEVLANAVTTRTREFGHIQGFVERGQEAAVVDAVLDVRTSCVCRALDGVRYPVAALVEQRDAIIASETPEATKAISPWLSCPEVERLVAEGPEALIAAGVVIPPYHGNCRSVLSRPI